MSPYVLVVENDPEMQRRIGDTLSEAHYALASEAGHVISADTLLAQVWGPEYAGEPQVVYVHIRWLREKLEEDPQHPHRIVTVRGVGYKLEPQDGETRATGTEEGSVGR